MLFVFIFNSSVLDLYEIMQKVADYINAEPKSSSFINLVNKLKDEDLISSQNHQEILDKVAENNEWIDKNYQELLVYFGLVQTTTPMGFTTLISEEQTTEPSTTSMPSTTPNSASSFNIPLILIFIFGAVKFI